MVFYGNSLDLFPKTLKMTVEKTDFIFRTYSEKYSYEEKFYLLF